MTEYRCMICKKAGTYNVQIINRKRSHPTVKYEKYCYYHSNQLFSKNNIKVGDKILRNSVLYKLISIDKQILYERKKLLL